jgi:hypothetical protein
VSNEEQYTINHRPGKVFVAFVLIVLSPFWLVFSLIGLGAKWRIRNKFDDRHVEYFGELANEQRPYHVWVSSKPRFPND